MKRLHTISLSKGGELAIYDAHCDPVTWVSVEKFKEEENLSKSQLAKLNKLIKGDAYEIVLTLPEIAY